MVRICDFMDFTIRVIEKLERQNVSVAFIKRPVPV